MESTVFTKMKLKQGTSGVWLSAPKEYVQMAGGQDYIDFSQREKYDFVHLFIESLKDYHERIDEALSLLSEKGALWISYPKSDRKNKYDVNRDILFAISPEKGIAACASAALDDRWSAMRFKRL